MFNPVGHTRKSNTMTRFNLFVPPNHAFFESPEFCTPIGTDLKLEYYKGEDLPEMKPIRIALCTLKTRFSVGLNREEAMAFAKQIISICQNPILNLN